MEEPSPPVHTPTPPVHEQRPVTPQRPMRRPPVHPLGWRRVGNRPDDLDNPDSFKWVPEHLTPRKFLDECKKEYAKTPGQTYFDYERLPAYWTPSRSPSPPSRQPEHSVPLPAPDFGNVPRRSGRQRQPAVRPDNVYGNRPPVDILAENEDDPFTAPPSDQRPGPSGNPSSGGLHRAPSADLTKMVQDGGAKLINFLLRAAVSSTDARGKIPDV